MKPEHPLSDSEASMEVLLRRRCCVGCNTEAATPPQRPQPLHKRRLYGGGEPLRKRLTLIYCIFIACHVLAHGPRNHRVIKLDRGSMLAFQ